MASVLLREVSVARAWVSSRCGSLNRAPLYTTIQDYPTSMVKPKPLDALKKAFSKLQNDVARCQKDLLDHLAKKEKLTESDENWLDNKANLVDEQCVIEALDAASDFECGVE